MIRLELAQYDRRWAEEFARHRERIAAALGAPHARIEHVGSTAVPGLAAKPIVDVAVLGISHDDPHVRAALEAQGYELAVDEPGHRMFKTPNRSAHVHLWADPADAEAQIAFRDWLRAHPDDRALYEHVKRQLVKREWETREHYADAKSAVVQTILRRARGDDGRPRIDAFARLLLDRLPPHSRILEIGAGEGLLARRLARAGHQVVALDTQLRSTFPIVERSFEEFHASAESFECAVAQLMLHHAADLNATLGKMAVLLKPGGIVAVDDYGWERSGDEAFRTDRCDLHTSEAMLAALRERFVETAYTDHRYVTDGAGTALGFTFIGRRR